jgi:hypothetical protein
MSIGATEVSGVLVEATGVSPVDGQQNALLVTAPEHVKLILNCLTFSTLMFIVWKELSFRVILTFHFTRI